MMDYSSLIRDIPDYPEPGIVFKDITPLCNNPEALISCAKELADRFRDTDIDRVVGAEARGFIFGPLIAVELKAGFVPVRKPGKLPSKTISESYELEYGTDTLEMHEDAIAEGEKVLIVDDLLATGGTVCAILKMIRRLKGVPAGVAALIELSFLNPADKIDVPIEALIKY